MRRFLLRPVWLAILICVLVPTAALAAERAEPITVRAVFEGQLPLAGMRFDVYRVADRSGGGTWSLELRFKGSKNQRIIDCRKSIESGSVVIKEL